MRAATLLTILALALAPRAVARDDARPPNVVIIFTDDQGYADVGCFGAEGYATPNLDRLAAEGMRFTDFHVSQAVCSASRAALLTGCYPNRIGILHALGPAARHGLAASETTIAELCRGQGYATACVGKWHLGHHEPFLPLQHGFDEFYGLPYSNDMWADPRPGHEWKQERWGKWPLPLIEGNESIAIVDTMAAQDRLTTDYTERAVSFIDRHADRPFFLYVAHSMPHVPLGVSDRFRGTSAQGLYGDVMMELDWSTGAILRALERHDLARDTLVVFTSDNGPWISFGDRAGSARPLREAKGTMWEGGCRVPCIMRWPGRIEAGTTCDDLVATIDLLPTIAGIIGADLPAHPIDGIDVRPALGGGASPRTSYLYYYARRLIAVREGDWKLVLPHSYRTLNGRPGGTGGFAADYEHVEADRALYDLASDVGETTNVIDAHPDVVARLVAIAEAARADLGDSATNRDGAGVREPGRLPDDASD